MKWEVIHIGVTIIATFEFRSRESFLPSLTEASQPGCYFTNIAGNVFGDFRGGHNASSIIIIIYNLCQKKRHVHFFIVNKNNNLYLFAFCRLRRLDTKVKMYYYIKDVRCIGIIGQLVTELIIICLGVIRYNFPKKTSYRKPKFYQISIVLDLKFNICSNIFCCPTYSFADHVLLYVIYERQIFFPFK